MSAPPDAQGSGARSWLPLVVAVVVAAICSVLLPVVPVLQTQTTVQWPAPGQAVESTMLTLVPYRPLELHASVPCAATTAPAKGLLLATSPAEGPGAGEVLVVRLDDGELTVRSERTSLWRGPAPPGCLLQIDVVGERSRVSMGDRLLAEVDVEPPTVSALATGLPRGTPALSARVQADSRFETSPTLLKRLLIGVAVLAGVACLVLLALQDRGRPRVPRTRTRWPWLQDLVLLAVLGFWLLAGPMLSDDGFNVAVADGFLDTGTVGNRYRWYNAPEAPFALVQQALVPLLELGRSPWLLRLPALLAGIGTWLLLSRSLLPRLAGGTHLRTAQWLGLVAFLAWWMPYDLGLRPEPFVALAATGVLVLVLRATESGRRLPLALAGVLAALALACAPSGLLAVAPFVVLARRVVPVLGQGVLPRLVGAAAVVTPGAVTAAVAVFADTGLAALVESTRIHQVIGPTYAWWEEGERYRILFEATDMGVFARRLPVLLAAGALVLLLATRRRGSGPRPDLLTVAAGCVALSFAVLVLTPSKWTHHFGGFAGYGALLLAGTSLQLRERLRREPLGVTVAACAGVVVLVAAAFAAPNLWVYHSSLGVPPLLPGALGSPVLWALLGAVLAVATCLLRSRSRPGWADVAATAPGATLALALATSVAVLLATFASSTVRLQDSWSMADQNLDHLTGTSCGMADHVEVLRPSPLDPVPGLPGEQQSRPGVFRRGGGFQPAPGSLPAAARRWGSLRAQAGPGREAGTGRLTSAWFAVPDLPRGAELGVAVGGGTAGGNSVVLEYAGRGAPQRVLQRQVVREESTGAVDWRYVTFGQSGPGSGAELVRVVVTDTTTGAGGWLAASQPLLMTPSLLRDVLLPGRTSIDYAIAFAYPCTDLVPVAHGVAGLPVFGITAEPERTSGQSRTLQHKADQGGTLAPAYDSAYLSVLPTRLVGLLPEDLLLERGWGTLVRYDYPHPGDRYALTTRREVRSAVDWGYRFPVPLEPEPLVPLDPFDPESGFDKG